MACERVKPNAAVYQLFTDFKKAHNSVRMEVLYKFLIRNMRLIIYYINETYNIFHLGTNLSDTFNFRDGLKQANNFSPISAFVLKFVNINIQEIQEGMKTNVIPHLSFYFTFQFKLTKTSVL